MDKKLKFIENANSIHLNRYDRKLNSNDILEKINIF